MYAKLSRSAALRGQLDKVTPHRGESHGNEKHTQTFLLFFYSAHLTHCIACINQQINTIYSNENPF